MLRGWIENVSDVLSVICGICSFYVMSRDVILRVTQAQDLRQTEVVMCKFCVSAWIP